MICHKATVVITGRAHCFDNRKCEFHNSRSCAELNYRIRETTWWETYNVYFTHSSNNDASKEPFSPSVRNCSFLSLYRTGVLIMLSATVKTLGHLLCNLNLTGWLTVGGTIPSLDSLSDSSLSDSFSSVSRVGLLTISVSSDPLKYQSL